LVSRLTGTCLGLLSTGRVQGWAVSRAAVGVGSRGRVVTAVRVTDGVMEGCVCVCMVVCVCACLCVKPSNQQAQHVTASRREGNALVWSVWKRRDLFTLETAFSSFILFQHSKGI